MIAKGQEVWTSQVVYELLNFKSIKYICLH
jgi:hypothetical protein